jgi:co-chaperonin GroES (HSP10)
MNIIDNVIHFCKIQKWTLDTIVQDFLVNILPAVLLFVLGYSWRTIDSYKDRRKFRNVYGKRAIETGITIAVAAFNDTRLLSHLDQKNIGIDPPQSVGAGGPRFIKKFATHSTIFPGGEELVAYASTRAATYIIERMPKIKNLNSKVISDSAVESKREGTYVSIGSSYTNSKTNQVKLMSQNRVIEDDMGNCLKLKNGKEFTIDQKTDVGYILKLINPNFKDNVLIACAGLGEWGSSGSAWYLARHWRDISRRFGGSNFIIVLRVDHGSDESAYEVFSTWF